MECTKLMFQAFGGVRTHSLSRRWLQDSGVSLQRLALNISTCERVFGDLARPSDLLARAMMVCLMVPRSDLNKRERWVRGV